MRYIIYCNSWEKGEEKFDEIVKQLMDSGISFSLVKRQRGSTVTTADGDYYQVVYAYDGARGHKWHICYVDEEISLRIFNTIIKPSEISQFMSPIQERQVYFF